MWAGGECWHQEKGSKSLLSCLPWHGDLKLQGKVTVSSKAAGGQSGDEIGVYVACFQVQHLIVTNNTMNHNYVYCREVCL